MKTYVMFRIYKIQAPDDPSARVAFREIEGDGRLEDYLVSVSIKEEQPRGLLAEVKRQITK